MKTARSDRATNVRVGAVLRRARKARRLTIEEAADAAHVGKSALGMWERGDRAIYIDELVTLCRTYGITPGAALRAMQRPVIPLMSSRPDGQE